MSGLECARDHFAERPTLLSVAIGLVALAIYLPAIGAGDFVGDDEALDTGVVYEMVRTGDWLFPEFNGEYLPPKPPLFYWEAALVSKLHGGADEWSLRVPSALAGAATVAVTVAGTARIAGPGPAALAGLLLSTTRVMHGQSRIGRCDMTMALLVTACLFLFHLADGPLPRSNRWLFYGLLGLLALAKGGAGVGLVAFVIVADALVTRRSAPIRSLLDPALLAFFVVGGGWYALGAWHWGRRFIDEQLVGENLNHLIGGAAVSDLGAGYRSIGYHLTYHAFYIFLVMLPWGFLLPAAVIDVWRSRNSPGPKRLLFFVVWLAGGLLFFSLAARKSPYYLLPLAPPTAVLVAAWISGRVKWEMASDFFDSKPSLRLAGLTIAVAALSWLLPFVVGSGVREIHAVRTAFKGHAVISIAILLSLVGFGVSTFAAARKRRWGPTLFSAWITTFAVLMLANLVQGPIDDCDSMKPFAEQVRERMSPEDRAYFFQRAVPAVALYVERRIPTLRGAATDPERPFYLIVPESYSKDVPPTWMAESSVVATGEGRVFTRGRMGIELLRIGEASPSLPIRKMAPGESQEVGIEAAVGTADAGVRDVPNASADRQRVVLREEHVNSTAGLRAELKVPTDIEVTE